MRLRALSLLLALALPAGLSAVCANDGRLTINSASSQVVGNCVAVDLDAEFCGLGDTVSTAIALIDVTGTDPSNVLCSIGSGNFQALGAWTVPCTQPICNGVVRQNIKGTFSVAGLGASGARQVLFLVRGSTGNTVRVVSALRTINRDDSLASNLTRPNSAVVFPGDVIHLDLAVNGRGSTTGNTPGNGVNACGLGAVSQLTMELLGNGPGNPAVNINLPLVRNGNGWKGAYDYVVPNGLLCGVTVRFTARSALSQAGLAAAAGSIVTATSSHRTSLVLIDPKPSPTPAALGINACNDPADGFVRLASCGCPNGATGGAPRFIPVSFVPNGGNSGAFTISPLTTPAPNACGEAVYRVRLNGGAVPAEAQYILRAAGAGGTVDAGPLAVSSGYDMSIGIQGTVGAQAVVNAVTGGLQPASRTQALVAGGNTFQFRGSSTEQKQFSLSATLNCYEPFPGPDTEENPYRSLASPLVRQGSEARLLLAACSSVDLIRLGLLPQQLSFTGTVRMGSRNNNSPGQANCATPPGLHAQDDPICQAVVTLLDKDNKILGSASTQADGQYSLKFRPSDVAAHDYKLIVSRRGFQAGTGSRASARLEACAGQVFNDLKLYLGPSTCPVGNPVDPVTGERRLSVTDLSVPGRAGLDFSFTRHYRAGPERPDLGLGAGWTHNWMVQLQPDGDGYLVRFTDGEWHSLVPDTAQPGRYKGAPGFFYALHHAFNRWNLTGTDGTRYEFDAELQLSGVTDRYGNHAQVQRDELGRIESIRDSAGRDYAFSYDPESGRLARLRAPQPGAGATHGRDWDFRYSGAGDLTQVDGPGAGSGYHASYAYDAGHFMTSKDDPKGPQGLKHLDIEYDAAGRVLFEKRKPTGEVVLAMQYGLEGGPDNQYTLEGYSTRLLVDPYSREAGRKVGSASTSVTWDLDNQGALSRADFRGNVSSSSYYPGNRGEIQRSEDPAGLVHEFSYDPYGFGVVTRRDAYHKDRPGVKRSYVSTVNSLGQVLSYQDASPSRVTTYEYDPSGFGQWTSMTDADGGRMERDFYPDGLVHILRNVRDRLETEYSYDGWGRVRTVQDLASGLTTTYTYDGAGNATRTDYLDAHGSSQVTDRYDDDGRLESRSDEEGQSVGYSYTADGRDHVGTETGPSGSYTRQHSYDPARNELSSVTLSGPDGLGGSYTQQQRYAYEQAGCCSAQGRLKAVTVDGASVGTGTQSLSSSYTYDDDGNRIREQSPMAGHESNSLYDEVSRLKTLTLGTGAEARTLQYAYTDFGERLSLSDGKAQKTTFEYDAQGQLRFERPPSGPALQYEYTVAGKLRHKGDRLSRSWDATYDDSGRLLTESFAGLSAPLSHRFSYGSLGLGTGQLLSVQDPTGLTEFSYGHRGRLKLSKHPALDRQVERRYTASGELEGLDLRQGGGLLLARQAMTYGPRHLMEGFSDFAGNQFSYKHDAAGQLRQVKVVPAGSSSIIPLYTATHSYDGAGRLLGISYRRHENGALITQVTYRYDEAGNRTQRVTLGSQASYSYNTLNELTADTNSADLRSPLGFAYDKAGNRQAQTFSGGSQAYSIANNLNRLNATSNGPHGAANYSYDAEGNLKSKDLSGADGIASTDGLTQYRWDGKNRLAEVTLPDSTVITYAYDYQNRLVKRSQGAEVRTYLYGSGTQVLEESLNGQRVALYSWGADGLASRTDAKGRTLFYLKDGLGSVIAVIDGDAKVVQSYEYSAYGECLSGKDDVNPFRFVGGFGGRADDATGLVYFWNRWYDPQVGRWVNEDPIRQEGGVNLYGYVANSPQGMIDATGMIRGSFGVQTFIPSYFLTFLGVPIGYGDGRHAGQSGSHRTSQSWEFETDRSGSQDGVLSYSSSVGLTETIIPYWAGRASADGMAWTSQRIDDCSIRIYFAAAMVNGAPGANRISPAINYHGSVLLRNEGGSLTYDLNISHDHFPAYEGFLNGSLIYQWEPPRSLWTQGGIEDLPFGGLGGRRHTGDAP